MEHTIFRCTNSTKTRKTWPILLPKTSDWIHIFCRWYKLLVWPDVNKMLSKLPCGFVFKFRYQFSFYFLMMFKKEGKKKNLYSTINLFIHQVPLVIKYNVLHPAKWLPCQYDMTGSTKPLLLHYTCIDLL